jgi:hypothetical protein
MAWPRDRDEPDSLRARRRQLDEQERQLAEKMSKLAQELRDPGAAEKATAPEPPVWRMDEETSPQRAPEMSSARRRNLARQRRRDKILFFLFIGLLLLATVIFFWVYQTHRGSD